MLGFQSMNLQNGYLSEWVTQGGKGMMAGRWRGPGMLGKLDVPDALDQNHYSELS
jgi:hypothetical protein